jgi:hypothetical protein
MSQSKIQTGKPRIPGRLAGFFTASLILTLTALATACGSHTVTYDSTSNGSSTNPTPTATPTPTVTVTVSPSPTPTENLLPPITESFTVTGASGITPSFTTTVDTDDVLRIKITAGTADKVSMPGYNFQAQYDCVKYTIEVMGHTVTTNVLAVDNGNGGGYPAPWGCYGASSSQVIDFSSRLSPGHGPVTVTVKAEGTNFYCKWCQSQTPYYYWANQCAYACPLYNVYKTHTVKGDLAIQVNGTSL